MRNSEATPRPWEVGVSNIIQVGTHMSDPLKATGVAQLLGRQTQAMANASLIAKSVNSYDVLLEACKTAVFGLTIDVEINKNPVDRLAIALILQDAINKAEER